MGKIKRKTQTSRVKVGPVHQKCKGPAKQTSNYCSEVVQEAGDDSVQTINPSDETNDWNNYIYQIAGQRARQTAMLEDVKQKAGDSAFQTALKNSKQVAGNGARQVIKGGTGIQRAGDDAFQSAGAYSIQIAGKNSFQNACNHSVQVAGTGTWQTGFWIDEHGYQWEVTRKVMPSQAGKPYQFINGKWSKARSYTVKEIEVSVPDWLTKKRKV